MRYDLDPRIVMTLDAGGTNLVFSAVQGNREIVEPITLPSRGDVLDACLSNLLEGFFRVRARLVEPPVAISFAFPGPGDYPCGIIGDLTNLPAFRGGVALGPLLEERFCLPVFINNDGDLFTYGEAIAGFLPCINTLLQEAGSPKRFRNLLGVTFGSGFGAGIVRNGELFLGDNSSAAEIWPIRNKLDPKYGVEEGVSIRGVKRFYAQLAGIPQAKSPEPKALYEIACGRLPGHQAAALEAFRKMGEVAGDAIANAVTMIDGLVVIGGGLAGASELFLPSLIAEMDGTLELPDGHTVPRMPIRAFNLEDAQQLQTFIRGDVKMIRVPGSERTVVYDSMIRIGVGLSRLGTSRSVGVGAYAFALHELDQRENDRNSPRVKNGGPRAAGG